MWLLDTPGILTPYVKDVETGMKLAMCGKLHLSLCISWSTIGYLQKDQMLNQSSVLEDK